MVSFHNIIDGFHVAGDHSGMVLPEPTPQPDLFPPDPPATAAPTAGHQSVALDWADNDDADFHHYIIYQATTAGGPYTQVATSTSSNYTVTGLTNGTEYFFVTTAVDDSGNESEKSDEVSETPVAGGGDVTPPAAPTNLALTPGDAQITLNWDDNVEGDLDHYLVKRSLVTGGPYTAIGSPTASTFVATGLANGTAYFFVVTAVDDSDNESDPSSEETETPNGAADTTAPVTPTGLSLIAGSGQVSLNWNDNAESDLSHYRVYRATSSGGTYSVVASPTQSTYTDFAVTAGTAYWYKVTALDVTGNESSQTAFVTGTPTTVSGVPIAAGASIQTAVNSNPINTTFILAAGTWNNQTVLPKVGNKFIGALGSSGQRLSILDGGGSTQHAIYVGSGTVSGVQIKNLIVEDYNPPTQRAALGGYGMVGGLIENCEVRENATGGLSFGSNMIVRGNYIHHNKQTGVYANGASDSIFENNEVSYNNYLDQFDPMWEAGGSKFLKTTNLILRGNNVHHNHGAGLWCDHMNLNPLYENNIVSDNHGAGIFHEISYRGTIRNNTVSRNGFSWPAWLDGCGILVNSSADVEIYGNTVVANNDGIGATFTNRTTYGGPWEVKNLYVHDNTIVQPTGKAAGIVTSLSGTGVFTTWNNRFENNDYDVPNPSSGAYWEWNGSKTWAQWQALGHDDTGSVT